MSVEEPELDRSARSFNITGARILLLGGILAVLGLVAYLIGKDSSSFLRNLGGALVWIGVAPTVIGLALLGISLVSHRAARHKPFA